MSFKTKEKKRLNWIANQPTPFHNYFHNEVKKSKELEFKVYFTLKDYAALPFKERNHDDEDVFLPSLRFGELIRFYLYALYSRDMFLITGWNNKYLLSILLIRRILNLPYCFYTDSVDPEKYRNSRYNGFKKFLLRRVKYVLTTGSIGIDKMVESGLYTDKPRIVSLPFFVRPPLQPIDHQTNITTKPLHFITMARLLKWKGVDIAIRALKIVKGNGYCDFVLNIGGIGPEMDALKELTKEVGIEENVVFHGWLNEKQKNELMYKSVALIHPVRGHDPFPLVINESLSAGLPVIGSDMAGSVVEFVKDEYNGYVFKAGDVEGLAASIIKFINLGEKEYVEMSEHARKLVTTLKAENGVETLRKITYGEI